MVIIRQLFFISIIILTALYTMGMVYFINHLPRPANLAAPVEGAVVFTGTAPERIEKGQALLAQGLAGRLLISGLYRGQDISEFEHNPLIDKDYRAFDTRGNVKQTIRWAKKYGFKKIAIVTSSHHMPRALLLLNRVAPELDYYPYAVLTPNVRLDKWWRYSGTFILLWGEYNRYIFTYLFIW